MGGAGSGSRPLYKDLQVNELLKLAESSLRQYFKDPAIPLQHKAALAAVLYSKAIKQVNETSIRLLRDNDIAILAKYDTSIIDANVIKRITATGNSKETEAIEAEIREEGRNNIEGK